MQHKSKVEKAQMMDNSFMFVPEQLSMDEDRQIQRIRKIFIIIVVILFTFSLVNLIIAFFQLAFDGWTARGLEIGLTVIPTLIYGFGLFVAYRYSSKGFCIFAWLGVIPLFFLGILIIIIFIGAIKILNQSINVDSVDSVDRGRRNLWIAQSLICFIIDLIYIAAFILNIIIIHYAFKLARLIHSKRCLIAQQI